MELPDADFLIALLKIIWVNVLLSGDNAVVIALAARSLPARQQRAAVVIGSGAAIVLRVMLTLFAVQLLDLPGLKLAGATLLVWIGIELLAQNEEPGEVQAPASLSGAVRTILLADLVMSLDNVLAVAAAANAAHAPSRPLLLALGLGLSIPLIIFGSTLLLRVMQRLPVLVTLGAALLGFVAGDMAMNDPALVGILTPALLGIEYTFSLGLAVLVVVAGHLRAGRKHASA